MVVEKDYKSEKPLYSSGGKDQSRLISAGCRAEDDIELLSRRQ